MLRNLWLTLHNLKIQYNDERALSTTDTIKIQFKLVY